MENKKCLHCGKDFIPQRSTKKFCKESCRVHYFQAHQVAGLKEDKERLLLRLKKVCIALKPVLLNPDMPEDQKQNIYAEIKKIKKDFPNPFAKVL